MNTSIRDSAQRVDAAGIRRPPPAELRAALDALFRVESPSRRVVDLDTRPLPYASSFAIEEVDVRFDDGSRLELVCKDAGEAGMLPEARRIRPRFLHDPLREVATYERILAPLGVGAPRFYGSAIDERRGRYWLFLERIHDAPMTEVGDFGVWRQVCSWLALMHQRVARHPDRVRALSTVPLVRYDRARAWLWMDRAQGYLAEDTARPRSQCGRFASLASRYHAVVEEVAALPKGFVHGEFFPSNVLVDVTTGPVRVRPVDWEAAGIGPWLMDLAALTAGAWTEDKRRELAASYRDAFDGEGDDALSEGAFMRALDCCRLQLAVQHLGWASRWTPPETHTQDWLGAALDAADAIGL